MAKIEKSVYIAAPIGKVWAALTDLKSIEGWMGKDSVAEVTLKEGGRYQVFGGETTGKFTRIRPPHSLEYTWRQANWPAEWADSRVHWELKPTKTGTQVKLTHDQFPNKDERDGHDEGWDTYWLAPMKKWLEAKA